MAPMMTIARKVIGVSVNSDPPKGDLKIKLGSEALNSNIHE